jgi:NADH-ubiquinone oxidoreductase chain 2
MKTMSSSQAFSFYLIQYSISSLNTFFILILTGYSLYSYVYNKEKVEYKELDTKESNNSPIQLINQIKGYFNINPVLSLSLTITFFSFIGVPPLIGFFAKYMVLFASINNGYIFMSLVAILTSVISGVYYLLVIKKIFFDNTDYTLNSYLKNINISGVLETNHINTEPYFNLNNVVLSSSITIAISVLTLGILLFIFISSELLNITTLLSLSYIY